uniref:Uncharacterized protein n=1 Tax=Alexandrium catenella TaxID=2925 RepID=A0A7S1S8D5_ALECA|mmetsp:Transcript_87854/g.233224  ORF Transcript_87854/g.233224 Transcript_87854/m.233224 type:complete len:117 (+) Transcript_87854:94-444(+)
MRRQAEARRSSQAVLAALHAVQDLAVAEELPHQPSGRAPADGPSPEEGAPTRASASMPTPAPRAPPVATLSTHLPNLSGSRDVPMHSLMHCFDSGELMPAARGTQADEAGDTAEKA